MRQKIMHHEDWQKVPLRRFLWEQAARRKGVRVLNEGAAAVGLPPDGAVRGSVVAYVNEGRWIAECPNGCGFAIVASEADPVFWCADCGGDAWQRVLFPRRKRAIERALLKRPAMHPFYASHRNWLPGETVEALERENEIWGVK
jgi:hypothetical protein